MFPVQGLRWLQLFWVGCLTCVCQTKGGGTSVTNESALLQQCISNFDPNVDYYQKVLPPDVTNQSFVLPIPLDLQEIDSATGFAVSYGNYFKVIENQFFNLTYILYQCGAPRPSLSTLGLPALTDARTFQLPLTNLSTDSTIPVAFLMLLGQLGNTSLTSSASEYISSSCVVQYIAEGDVKAIADSDITSTDAVFTAADGFPGNEINAVSFDATYDGGPLKRAEWIKYLATFLNVEDRAETVFSYVSKSYQCMNASMKLSDNKPTVAWIRYSDGIWSLSNATYKLQFDSDAGGVNLDSDTLRMTFNLSLRRDLDSFHQLLKQMDVVVDETYAPDPYSYTFKNFASNAQVDPADPSISLLMKNRVWRIDKRVGLNAGLDWYEGAISQPHVVLFDLIGILYPSKGWNQTYFRNIALDEKPINVSALVCNCGFGQAEDPMVIPDREVMRCMDSTAVSGSLATTLPSWRSYLLPCMLVFLSSSA